ncbi:hypothetical protein SAMN05216326_11648 [Nitrosomonas marina]|uniref:Surface-adhesin protein E-like domain-containing protein n=1 Tax=Nitrosomonas marina TaxID=917 RepID=A0A1I0CUC7_9PROT|nr:surface-adhesin E family protein [Nitrosomonas marina]SET23413.1 hypothetical protein SAMN05216326_11648 [Nitrosomonas marina]
MKKLLLTIMLFCLSTSIMAEWTQVLKRDDKGGFTVYADMQTIRKVGNVAKMWTLVDYKLEQEDTGANFLSKKVRKKYNCQNRHTKELAYKLYSWNMGGGEQIRSYSQPQEWIKITPGSVEEAEWIVACGHPELDDQR